MSKPTVDIDVFYDDKEKWQVEVGLTDAILRKELGNPLLYDWGMESYDEAKMSALAFAASEGHPVDVIRIHQPEGKP